MYQYFKKPPPPSGSGGVMVMMKILRGWLFSGAVAYKRYTKPSIIRTIRDTVILLYENNLLDNT